MLDDPRMTNSTFIEGYSTDGTLHYAPYTNDARVSHAHGWSTGPTAALSFFVAGLHLTGPAGATWRFAPQPGDLTSVDAGYTTALGLFSTTFKRSENGDYQELTFTTPQGTTGDVDLAGAEGTLVSADGERVFLVKGTATGITGGSWNLEVASQ